MDPTVQTCPRCGTPLRPGAPEGLCPVCLLVGVGARNGSQEGPQALGDVDEPQVSGRLGSRWVGNYELLEEIGHGGMGVVFKARQRGLNRIVAVKMVLAGQFTGPEAVARFRAEAELAAQLQHPNIVAIHEVGEHDGEPFFSMDYVEGRNLVDLTREHPLPARAAAGYLQVIAEAIDYAHQMGVLHRDIKPANILIDTTDQPRITDFGLAKRLYEDSELTQSGQVLGSPSYASPEQVMGLRHQIGPASDIYSLGAVLYHLLVRRPPFVTDTLGAAVRQVQEVEPVPVRRLNPNVPADLETICHKCLEKDPQRRYATATALAEDLKRFLRSEPILARPPGPAGRIARWCRRKPVVAGLVGVSGLLALAILIGSPLALYRIQRGREQAEREAYYSSIGLAKTYVDQGNIDQAMSILTNCPAVYRHWEWGHLMYLCHKDMVSFKTRPASVEFGFLGGCELAFGPQGWWLMSISDGLLQLWDCSTRQEVLRWGGPTNGVRYASFGVRGTHLAVALSSGDIQVLKLDSSADSSPALRAQMVLSFPAHQGPATHVSWIHWGMWLLTAGGDSRVRLWDADTGARIIEFAGLEGPALWLWYDDNPGDRVVAWSRRHFVEWNAVTGAIVRQVSLTSPAQVRLQPDITADCFAFSEAGGRLSLGATPGEAKELVVTSAIDPHGYQQAFFSPDHQWLCNTGDQGTARVWNLANRHEHFAMPIRVRFACFSPDSRLLATTGGDNFVVIWDVGSGRELQRLYGHHVLVQNMAFTPDSRQIATIDQSGVIKLWPADPGRERLSESNCVWAASYSPDGQRIAVSGLHRGLTIWNGESGELLTRIKGPLEWISGTAFSPDGSRLVTVGSHRVIRVWETGTWKHLATWSGHEAWIAQPAFSKDGRWLFTYSIDGAIKLWEFATGRVRRAIDTGITRLFAAALSPNGQYVAAGDSQGLVRVWDAASGQALASLPGHSKLIYTITFAPDNARLLTCSVEGTSRIWDWRNGRTLAAWTARGCDWPAAFSKDGRRIFAGTTRQDFAGFDAPKIAVRDAATGRELLSLEGAGVCARVQYHSPSQRLLTGSFEGLVRQFEAFPWRESDYPGIPTDGLTARIRWFADRYWALRFAAESQRWNRATTNAPLLSFDWEPSFFPERDPRASRQQIDLRKFYTAPLTVRALPIDGPDESDFDLRHFPQGWVSFGGVWFDVRGVIQLSRTEVREGLFQTRWQELASAVRGIPITQKCHRLVMLHGSAALDAQASGTVIGRYVCHYADGGTQAFDLVFGVDIESPKPLPNAAPAARGLLVWEETAPGLASDQSLRRVYLSAFENPRPEVEIVSLDFVSQMTTAAPFLVALTVE